MAKGAWMVWGGGFVAIALRLVLAAMGSASLLDHRVEVVTPVTSLARCFLAEWPHIGHVLGPYPIRTIKVARFGMAEGHWLKEYGLSPYAGSAYHASPLLLSMIGPVIGNRQGTSLYDLLQSCLLFVIADFIGALLLRSMGKVLDHAHKHQLSKLGLCNTIQDKAEREGETIGVGDVAFLTYLLNPFTIAACVGGSTSSIENLQTILGLYGATTAKVGLFIWWVAGIVPLAAFGWAMATHLSMYPVFLFIPISYLLANGPDSPPSKLFKSSQAVQSSTEKDVLSDRELKDPHQQSSYEIENNVLTSSRTKWVVIVKLVLWSAIWWMCILGLCKLALQGRSSLIDMWSETYKYMLTVEDLTPNLGLFWYFFTEVFDFFRTFFLMVFHANIVFMVPPLTIRLHHRPMFLAFILTTICSMLKSYPTVGDAALYLGMMALCVHELTDLQYSYVLLNGYILISVLGPVMYNLWIFRGTGNANFYFAINLVYATLQTILIVESVSTVIRYDNNLQKQVKLQHTQKSL